MKQHRGFRRAGLSALLGLSVIGSGTLAPLEAVAQDLGCECVASPGATTLVRSVVGRVNATQADGLVPVASNQTLRVPGRVVTGRGSSAVVAVGRSCQVNVGPSETLDVGISGGNLCAARMNNVPGEPAVESTAGGGGVTGFKSLDLVGLAIGLGGVGAIAASTNDPDNGVSR